jgi:hypothetical protein
MIVLPFAFLLLAFWILIRDKRQVSLGEMSIGEVTGVRLRRRGLAITYEFLDRSGRLITASSPDDTRSFSPGMVIPIFYSPKVRRQTKSHCVLRFTKLLAVHYRKRPIPTVFIECE